MDNNSFISFLRYALWDNETLELPGIGTFKLHSESAKIDVANQVISPPIYSISYVPSYFMGEPAFKELVNQYYPTSNEEIEKFILNLKDGFDTGQTILIPGIGSLNKNHFTADSNTLEWFNQKRKPLKLRVFKHLKNLLVYSKLQLSSLPHASWNALLPFAVMSLLSFGLIKYNWQNGKPTLAKSTPQKIQETLKETLDTIRSENTNEDSLLNIDKPVFEENKSEINSTQIQITNVKQNKDGTFIKRCVIITGVYADNYYKNKMKELITSKGYVVFEQAKNNKTKVGLQFDCHENNLNEYLQKVRNEIDSGAWYLILNEKEG